jgi:peptidoglycan/xylan/chitin deacetylase (PgdA/CDA1 family)
MKTFGRLVASVLVIAGLAWQGTTAEQPARRVAITIDDGPAVASTDLANFERITAGLTSAFQTAGVPVTMFVNEAYINVPGERDRRAAVLDRWLDAGLDLGNHTYAHTSANRVPADAFEDDVVRGEVITRAVLGRRGRDLIWFRYPYLHSGTTDEAHTRIVSFLEARKYRVAPITVDYADYTFASAWAREMREGRAEAADRIRAAYLDQVGVGFEYAERSTIEIFGREIPQILLIHCNELNSVTLAESLARMRERGYTFISLDEAMRDEAYQRPDTFTGPGGSWQSRTAASRSLTITAPQPRVPQWITDVAPQVPQPAPLRK